MIETETMKNPNKSFDVFEFKVEDELTEMAAEKIAAKFGCSRALDVSSTEIQPNENDNGLCGSADAATTDNNHDASGSLAHVATKKFAEKTPELSHVVQHNIEIHGLNEEKSNINESVSVFCSVGCRSNHGATMRQNDHSNCAYPESSCNDKSLHLGLDANESMNERYLPDIANTSTDGPSSDNCLGGWDLAEERAQIVFYPDYIDYCSTHYLDPVVCFSRSYVEARSKAINGDEENFHIHLEIEDIVKIESQWCAKYEAGTISIIFISKDVAKCDIDIVHNASGLQELRFLAVDSNWYKKQEAIESLDVRYRALWSVLLDTGAEKCSALPEGEARMLTRSYFPNFDRPFEEVIYPKGDPDAVSISKSDVDRLLPDIYVNDTIIDFYIKYLRTRQNVDERPKFHFFNSFFFRKLADMDRDPSSAFDGKAAFRRVRKWTRKVNLLEKDFIFIPINYTFHWSLIVICYFGEVANYKDDDEESERVPCILHMDSMRGTHTGLKDLIQSYLWEEWKERQKGPCEDLYSKFRNLKFVPLELPQQQNSSDCGIFLLHYVELFLEEVPFNFSIYKITSSSKFLQPDWFPPSEASMKRTHIERLINGLLDAKFQDCPPCGESDMHWPPQDQNTTHDYEEGVNFSINSGPMGGCHESSSCRVGHGIEMTLLPSSSTLNTQCTRTSGLVLKDLFKRSAPETLIDATWGAFESREPLYEFKRLAPIAEVDEEAGDSFATELAGPVFQHLDDVAPEAPTFTYSSEDFRLEPVHEPIPDDVSSSPIASGQLLNAEETQNLVEGSERNDDPIFLNNLSELGQPNELQNHGPVCPPNASGDKLDVSELESPCQMLKPNDEGNEGEWMSESADEERVPKRMRITPTDLGGGLAGDLSKDELHL